MALLGSESCVCLSAHACGSRLDALVSRPVHFTKGDGCHINPMPRVTKGVIEVARESVVIGPL